jgi:hypothetical protein
LFTPSVGTQQIQPGGFNLSRGIIINIGLDQKQKKRIVMHYMLRPEVPGELGEKTIMDSSVHPPIIKELHIIFKGWLEDDIVKCFPVFLVTERLAMRLSESGFTGFELRECIIQSSEELEVLQPETQLPKFLWLNILSKNANTDFYINEKFKLTVSENAFELLKKFNLKYCQITKIDDTQSDQGMPQRISFWRKYFG